MHQHTHSKLNFTSENMLCANKSGFDEQLNQAMMHVKQHAVEMLKATANDLDLMQLDCVIITE